MAKVSGRNAELEMLRFVFAICILGIHLGNVSDFSYFHNGHIGVEFFLILSGILMAQSYHKSKDKEWFINNSVGTNTVQFIIKKIRVFLPLLLVIIGAKVLLFFIQSDLDIIRTINLILDFIPTAFMTPMSGAGFSNDLGII